MQYSGNSVVPVSSSAVPWVSVQPPSSTLIPTQGQGGLRNYSIPVSNGSMLSARYYVFTFLSAVLIIGLVGLSVALPLVVAFNSPTPTTQTTTTMTTVTTTSATTITTTSATTVTSTTRTTVTTSTSSTTTISTSSTTTTRTTSTTTTSSTSTTATASSTTSSTTTMAPLQWNTTGLTLAGQAGTTSAGSCCFNLPIGIWLESSSNRLYVADGNNHRIQRFTLGNTSGTTVAGSSTGVVGANATLLNYPNDIALDSSGNMYVVDAYNNRVQLWYVNSTSGVTIAGNGTAGNSSLLLNWPRAIAFGANTSTYFISDSNNDRVMMYTLGSTVGTVVAGGNGGGSNRNQLNNPRGLYYESSTNSLLIANADANNIVRWVIGASNWTIVAGNTNGTAGNGSSSLNGPWDVTLDSLGNVYVADRYNHRIQLFLAGQTNGTTIGGVTGTSGTTATRLNQPLSVALDSQYNLYVSDSFNYRMQKFFRI